VPDPTATPNAAKVSKIVDVPPAQLLDGFAAVNESARRLMSGDAQIGTLYLIDAQARTATAVLQDPLLKGTSRDAAIKFRDGFLYFTNTAKGLYGKVSIDGTTGRPKGNPSIIDHLSFDRFGNQFISEPLRGLSS
ncbi:MAG: hypothetical protein Q9217_005938, partial [Psora testacea]